MGTHHLFCSVCEGTFDSKDSWNEHLLEEPHQRLVREDCSKRWWEDEQLRQCCLVVFSSVPITIQFGRQLISKFSQPARVYVTDFVRWEEKPQVALLQFESRTVAKKIWSESGSPGGNAQVDGHRIQLKEASAYMELEWEELIPRSKFKVPPCLEGPVPVVLPPEHFVLKDFTWISTVTSYSSEDIAKLEHLQNELKTIVGRESCKTILMENHNLGLRTLNCGVNLFLFSHSQNDLTFFPAERSKKIQIKDHLMKEFEMDSLNDYPCPSYYIYLESHASKLPVSILLTTPHLLEAQACQLIAHLCKFDSRLRPVLTLVTFWSNYHKIRLNQPVIKGKRFPDPLGVHLMTVLFFMRERLIPSTKQLLSEEHTPMILTGKMNNVDVGFSQSDKVVDKWKETHLTPSEQSEKWKKSIVQLTCNMFLFYSSKMTKGRWLWSSHDGIVISPVKCGQYKRSTGEEWPVGDRTNQRRIFVAHPFHRSWPVDFSVEAFDSVVAPAMKKSVPVLKEYLEGGKRSLADALVGGSVDFNRVQSWQDSCPLRKWNPPCLKRN